MNSTSKLFCFSKDVKKALQVSAPVVAFESTIISHGMPYPRNFEFALQAENVARAFGAVPATIAILDGTVHVGLNRQQLKRLSKDTAVEKTAVRDIAVVLAKRLSGATTVSATMRLAYLAGIPVFATGGIGGVHRGAELTFDISQDLKELGRTPVVVVSAGAKAILDLPKTLEVLESEAVPVFGYQTDDFPAFYSGSSGVSVPTVINSAEEISEVYHKHRELKMSSGLLIANPIPKEDEIPFETMETYIRTALDDAHKQNITGKGVTPFLLKKVKDLTAGKSLSANIALALNNVKLASEIAAAIQQGGRFECS